MPSMSPGAAPAWSAVLLFGTTAVLCLALWDAEWREKARDARRRAEDDRRRAELEGALIEALRSTDPTPGRHEL